MTPMTPVLLFMIITIVKYLANLVTVMIGTFYISLSFFGCEERPNKNDLHQWIL